MRDNIFRVSTNTDSRKLAQAIMNKIQFSDEIPTLSCLGAGAINQAVKALSILIGMGSTIGLDIYFKSHFEVRDLDGSEKTFINFKVYKI